MTRRRIAGTFAVLAVTVLGTGVGLAWACTYQPVMTVRSANPAVDAMSAPPEVSVASAGSPVLVEVSTIDLVGGSSTAPVEVRWNALDGAVLASTRGPSFSVPVQIPADAAPGVYSIVAVSRDLGGAVATKVSRSIEVSGRGSAGAQATGPWARSSSQHRSSTSGGSSTQVVGGALLLGLGLVGLFSAFTVLSVRRRRALASTPSPR